MDFSPHCATVKSKGQGALWAVYIFPKGPVLENSSGSDGDQGTPLVGIIEKCKHADQHQLS